MSTKMNDEIISLLFQFISEKDLETVIEKIKKIEKKYENKK